jgi:PAS domain S-box-containing protein
MEEMLANLPKTMGNLIVFASVVVTILYIFFKNPKFVDFLAAKRQKTGWKIVAAVLLSLLIMAASKFALSLVAGGARVNIRDSIAILAAILAGPIVGIVVGLAGGIYRITLGGWTALPCGLATITISIIAAYFAKYKGYRISEITTKQIKTVAIIAGGWEVIHTMVYCPLMGTKPVSEAFTLMWQRAAIPMIVTNVIAVMTFLFVCRDAIVRKKSKEEIEKYSKTLEKKVVERTKELDEKIYELEESITKQKKAEEGLRESEGRYSSLINDGIDSLSSGIFILDKDFKVVWANKSIEDFFGLDRDRLIGVDKRKAIKEEIKYVFEKPERFENTVINSYDNNTYIENLECHVLTTEDRKERFLEHWSIPIKTGFLSGGRIEHYYDITKRKQAEKKMQEKMNELEIYYNATIGREERIIELKHEVNDLLKQIGKQEKYGV